MSLKPDPVQGCIQNSRRALQHGDKAAARYWAQRAAVLDPNSEDAWLILAAVANPRASLAYLKQALVLNPYSQRARRGLTWAIHRSRTANYPKPSLPSPMHLTVAVHLIYTQGMERKKANQAKKTSLFTSDLVISYLWRQRNGSRLAGVSNLSSAFSLKRNPDRRFSYPQHVRIITRCPASFLRKFLSKS